MNGSERRRCKVKKSWETFEEIYDNQSPEVALDYWEQEERKPRDINWRRVYVIFWIGLLLANLFLVYLGLKSPSGVRPFGRSLLLWPIDPENITYIHLLICVVKGIPLFGIFIADLMLVLWGIIPILDGDDFFL